MSIEINGKVFEDENAPDALKAKLALVESEKEGVVNELKGDRTKNREAIEKKEKEITDLQEALKAAATKNVTVPTEDDKIASVVKAVFAERDGTKAQSDKKAAFDKFVNEHKEYHPENDAGGIKRAALEKELAGLVSWVNPSATDDFAAVIGKANALLRGNDTSRQNPMNTPSSMPNSPSEQRVIDNSKLSSKETELIDRNGWTEEQYLKLKDKMPDYFDSLLSQMR